MSGSDLLLTRLDRGLSAVEDLFNVIAGWVVFGLMLLAVAQIILRSIFNAPILGYIDIVELFMIVFTIGGIAYCQRLGGHVRMEILLKPLKGRTLWIVEALGVALAFVVIAIIGWYSIFHFLRAWDYGNSTIDIELAVWPAKLFVPVIFTVLLARLALQFWGYCRLAANPDATPIAVSLMIDEEEAARREIEESQGHDAANAATKG